MPPRTSAKTRGGDASASRARKPAMKRGGKSGGGGGRKGGPARGAPGLAKAKIPKGKAAAHHQQSFYDVDDEEEDFAGRAAAMDDEFGDVKGQYDDLPSDFEDEEIDEDEAFTEEDKRRYGDIAFESFGKKKGGKRAKDDRFDDDDEFDFGEEDEEEDEDGEDDEDDEDDEDGVMLDSDEDEEDDDEDEEDAEDDADSLLASDEEAERAHRDVDDEEDDDEVDEDDEDDEDEDEDEDASASASDSDSDAAHAALLQDVVGARSSAGDKKRRLKRGLTEAYAESEFGVAPRVGTSGDDDDALPGGAGGLSVSTLMAAAMGGDASGGDALGGARRRLDRLANKKAKPDAAPLPKIVSERVDRKAAYEATGEAVSKWQPIVKQNREKPTLTFVDQERAKMPRKKSIAALNADFVPENDFEREIMAKLRETNATTGRDVERAEDLALNELTAEEVKERRARLAKMRNLLFRHELKAKRVKAIKSKTFHRHNRKTGALKILDGDGNEVDAGEDDDALAGLDGADGAEARREYLRAQERMLLKHKNTSRWAKRAIRKGLAHLPGTKEAIAEQLRIGQELRRKIGIGGERRGGDGDDDDDGYGTEASSDDDDDDGEGDDRRRLAKAKAATLRAIQDGEKGAEEEGGLFALPFMARALKKKREEAEAEAKALLEEIERADRRAGGGGDGDDDDDDAGEGRWGAGAESFEPAADDDALAAPAHATRRSFGGKPTAATRASKRKAAANAAKAADEDAEGENRGGEDAGAGLGDFGLDDDHDGNDDASNRRADAPSRNDGVIKARGGNRAAARAAAAGATGASEIGAAPANVAASVPRELPRGAGAAKARQAARQAGRAAAVAAADAKTKTKTTSHPGGGVDMRADVDDDDADDGADGDGNRNAFDASDASDQRALLARAFAGDDVAAAFDAEKAAEVEAELPKTEVPKQMPGWGGWAEDQARRPTPKWQIDAERKAKRARDAAAKSRADANLKRVVISEKFDKKAAGFNVEHLPHGFDSKDVYEGSMRAPLGSDVNTDRAFRDLTRPKVLKNAGAVIRPMAFPKGKKGAAKK